MTTVHRGGEAKGAMTCEGVRFGLAAVGHKFITKETHVEVHNSRNILRSLPRSIPLLSLSLPSTLLPSPCAFLSWPLFEAVAGNALMNVLCFAAATNEGISLQRKRRREREREKGNKRRRESESRDSGVEV